MGRAVEVINWEDPPPTPYSTNARDQPGHSTRFSALAETLKSRPGEWALVFTGYKPTASSIASSANQASVKCFRPRGTFQATIRSHRRTTKVFMRYVGE